MYPIPIVGILLRGRQPPPELISFLIYMCTPLLVSILLLPRDKRENQATLWIWAYRYPASRPAQVQTAIAQFAVGTCLLWCLCVGLAYSPALSLDLAHWLKLACVLVILWSARYWVAKK
jgi:hypothetical protein